MNGILFFLNGLSSIFQEEFFLSVTLLFEFIVDGEPVDFFAIDLLFNITFKAGKISGFLELQIHDEENVV